MATSQMHRTQQHQQQRASTSTWSSVFPPEQVTPQQSTLFVKKLLAVAISNITYLRTIFPEHAFGDRCLEDLSLKILRDDSGCPGACQIIQWVKGCFDALDKKYLRMIVMAIYKDENHPNDVVESYTFKFSYSDGDDSSVSIYRNGNKIAGANGASETRKATIKLLRTIVVLTQTLRPLPDDVMMTMKLFYYEDVTPCDYEPPGFEATDDNFFTFNTEPLNIKVGDISTPFHSVKVRIKTDCQQLVLNDEDDDITSPAKPLDTSKTPIEPIPSIDQASGGPSPPMTGTQKPIENITRCPCAFNKDEGLMVMCGYCNHWQHAACFGLRYEEDVPEFHTCELCAAKENYTCTDPSLTTLSIEALQSVCLWRRTLIMCLNMNRVQAHALAKRMNIEQNIAQGLMNRLEREGYIQLPAKGTSRHWKTVLKEVIQTVAMDKYFLTTGVASPESQDEKKDDSDTIEQLTDKTSSINLMAPSKTSETTVEEPKTRRSLRLAKRARSVSNPSLEFEVSYSQDILDNNNDAKKRKVSVASKSILV